MVRIIKLAAVVALVTALSGCIFPPPGGEAVGVVLAAVAVQVMALWDRIN